MKSKYEKLCVELLNNKSLTNSEKDIILSWMNRSFEIGMDMAGDILSSELSKYIEEFAKNTKSEVKE